MSNSIFLHVGMPKTGSTSLQTFLSTNLEKLYKNNFVYPNLYFKTKINSDISDSNTFKLINGRIVYFSIRRNDFEYMDLFYDYINNVIKNFNLIISDECFWLLPDEMLINFIKNLANRFRLNIIIYKIRKDMYLYKLANQFIYEYYFDDVIDDTFLEQKNYNFYERITKILKIIPKQRLIIREYPEDIYQFKNGTVSDFLRILNMKEYDEDKIIIKNLSPTGECLEIKRIFNSNIKKRLNSQLLEKYRLVFTYHFSNYIKKFRPMMTPIIGKLDTIKLLNEDNAEIRKLQEFGYNLKLHLTLPFLIKKEAKLSNREKLIITLFSDIISGIIQQKHQ